MIAGAAQSHISSRRDMAVSRRPVTPQDEQVTRGTLHQVVGQHPAPSKRELLAAYRRGERSGKFACA